LQSEPVKNAFFVDITRHANPDGEAVKHILLAPPRGYHLRTMQISPRAAFFPWRHDIIIAFQRRMATRMAKPEVTNVMPALETTHALA
jgi:hypothetical protein